MSLEPGQRIGDYEIIGVLGAGGMGKVYKVRNFISNRIEAMKVLLPDLTGNREIAERFLREIRVLASLDHPNIAELRTAQRADRQVLMIMEFIDGQSLDSLLRRGPIPRAQMLSVLDRVLDALEYAHQRGIVHRDIKPSNIMVTTSGDVKLMDFGIAKLKADRQLTASGSTLGSLYYMSPEQIQGAENVDARSDVYSLGICMYEMATGTKPFDAGSEFSLMSAHLNDAPRPPAQIDGSIPDSLSSVILKALAKDRTQRYQSAGEMANALRAVRADIVAAVVDGPSPEIKAAVSAPGSATPATPALSPARSRRFLWVTAGSLATAAVLIAALVLIPKFTHTAATSTPRSVVQEPKPSVPVDTLPAEPKRDSAEQTATQTAAGSQTVRPVEPASDPPKRAQAALPGGSAPTPSAHAQEPASSTPQQQSQPQVQQQPPPPPPAGPSKAELNAVREEYNQLAIRAATAKTGLQGLQNQMGGLGLRADMRETAARLDYLMQEAMTAIRSGDTETARKNLEMADRAAERIEKFLGR